MSLILISLLHSRHVLQMSLRSGYINFIRRLTHPLSSILLLAAVLRDSPLS